jgi:hypothetical protein
MANAIKEISINLLAILTNRGSFRVSSSIYSFEGRKIKYYKGLYFFSIPFWGGFFLRATQKTGQIRSMQFICEGWFR